MKTLLSFIFVLGLTLFITGCGSGSGSGCLRPSSDDSTVPKTSVTVVSYDGSGQEITKSVSSDEQKNLSVEIPKGQAFQVIYTANDEGGVQSMKLRDGVDSEINTIFIFENELNGEVDYGSCPQPYKTQTRSYYWEEEVQNYNILTTGIDLQEEAPEYNFQTVGIDLNGNESKTPILTVKFGG